MNVRLNRWSGGRRTLAIAAMTALVTSGVAAATMATPAQAQAGCQVDFSANQWGDGGGGFTASLTISGQTNGWTLQFTLPGGASLIQGWSATWDSNGSDLTATDLGWNANLGSTTIGFNGSGYAGEPTTFTLNGVTCNGGQQTTPPPAQTTPPPGGGQPVFESCDQWAMWQTDGWTLYNNIWGSGAGSQCIWANSPTNWGVVTDHPNTGGVKSYPNIDRWSGQRISEMNNATSSFDVSVPTSNVAFTTAYDIWNDDNTHEIMVWVNRFGPVGAIGSFQQTVNLSGATWDFYLGGHSNITVYSFLRHNQVMQGSIDIAEITNWLLSNGIISDVTIGQVQFGFEITSGAGNQEFTVNDYSVTLN